MLLRQDNALNRSRTPERRQQVQPGPAVLASSSEIEALDVRVTTAEGGIAALQAQDVTTDARLTAVEGDVAFLDAGLAAATDRLDDAEVDIGLLQAHEATQDGQISTLQGQVAALSDGHLSLKVRKITASATASATDYLILADATAGNIIVTLPALSNGRVIAIKKIDATANTVSIAGAANIDGAASQLVTPQYASFVVMCDGATWWIV